MKNIKIITLVVLVLFTGIVGVRIADPFAPEHRTANVDFTDAPDEIAHAAMRQTGVLDYEVRFKRRASGSSTSGSVNTSYWARYENTDHQVAYGNPGGSTVNAFKNSYYHWHRNRERDSVTRQINQLSLYGRFHEEGRVLRCGCVQVYHENESILVLRITDPDLVPELRFGPINETKTETARLDFYIDKETQRLRATEYRAVYNGTDGRIEDRAMETYHRWGEVDVERPSWAAFSTDEFLRDLLNDERKS